LGALKLQRLNPQYFRAFAPLLSTNIRGYSFFTPHHFGRSHIPRLNHRKFRLTEK